MHTVNNILTYIETQKKNIEFIKERLNIQAQEGYNPNKLICTGSVQISKRKREATYIEIRERQYYPWEIGVIEEKIKLAEKKLK